MLITIPWAKIIDIEVPKAKPIPPYNFANGIDAIIQIIEINKKDKERNRILLRA